MSAPNAGGDSWSGRVVPWGTLACETQPTTDSDMNRRNKMIMHSEWLPRLEALLSEFRAEAKAAPSRKGCGFGSSWHLYGYVFTLEESIARLRKHERRVAKIQEQLDQYRSVKMEVME